MRIYTYSQARQRLASLLDEASREGSVRIRRRDGRMFEVAPVALDRSALEVDGLNTGIARREIVSVIRESRRQRPGPQNERAAAPARPRPKKQEPS